MSERNTWLCKVAELQSRKSPAPVRPRGGGQPIGRRPGGGSRHGNSSWNDALIDTKFQSSSLEPASSPATRGERRGDSRFRLFSFGGRAGDFTIELEPAEANKSLMALPRLFIENGSIPPIVSEQIQRALFRGQI